MDVLMEVERNHRQRPGKPVEMCDSRPPGDSFFVRVERRAELIIRPLLPVGSARLAGFGARTVLDRELEFL